MEAISTITEVGGRPYRDRTELRGEIRLQIAVQLAWLEQQ
jgi:hypothetical protein